MSCSSPISSTCAVHCTLTYVLYRQNPKTVRSMRTLQYCHSVPPRDLTRREYMALERVLIAMAVTSLHLEFVWVLRLWYMADCACHRRGGLYACRRCQQVQAGPNPEPHTKTARMKPSSQCKCGSHHRTTPYCGTLQGKNPSAVSQSTCHASALLGLKLCHDIGGVRKCDQVTRFRILSVLDTLWLIANQYIPFAVTDGLLGSTVA